MTLNELYKSTTDWTLRHVIQDEIAMSGKDHQVDEFISNKLQKLIELKPMSQWTPSDFSVYNALTGQSGDEQFCEECGHLIKLHDAKYGCEYERGDGWVTGNQASAPTVLCALGPCGCMTPAIQ